jgi:hypothetical protein
MLAKEYLLQVMSKRVEFWRDQLQAAFRSGNTQRIGECTLLLEEYGLLMTQAMSHCDADLTTPLE